LEIEREIQTSASVHQQPACPPQEPPPAAAPQAAVPERPPEEIENSIPQPQAAFFEDMELNQHYTFSEFIIGPNNRFTAAAAQAVAENPGRIYNPFFIYGGVGLGKTHLMNAVGHHVRNKSPKTRIIYESSWAML
jgi:chromosomal replication initiator protein